MIAQIPPLTPEIFVVIYQKVPSILGLDQLEPEERTKHLLTIPMDDIIAQLPPSVAFMPMIDGELGVDLPSLLASSSAPNHLFLP